MEDLNTAFASGLVNTDLLPNTEFGWDAIEGREEVAPGGVDVATDAGEEVEGFRAQADSDPGAGVVEDLFQGVSALRHIQNEHVGLVKAYVARVPPEGGPAGESLRIP